MLKSPRTLWVRPSKLLWLPAIAAAIGGAVTVGTPHMLWSYRYTGSSDSKYFLSCDYLGSSSQRVTPHDGKCPFILLLKPVPGGSNG